MNRLHLLSAPELSPRLRRAAGSASKVSQYARLDALRRTTAEVVCLLVCRTRFALVSMPMALLGVRGSVPIGTGNQARRMDVSSGLHDASCLCDPDVHAAIHVLSGRTRFASNGIPAVWMLRRACRVRRWLSISPRLDQNIARSPLLLDGSL
jgi:hypothetical protein